MCSLSMQSNNINTNTNIHRDEYSVSRDWGWQGMRQGMRQGNIREII